MEVRILQDAELANAAGLSRYVFDVCLRNRMEFVQSIGFVEDYLKFENLTTLYRENKLTVWGVFEEAQLVGVAGLQSDGMITMLYVLPQCTRRGYGSALLETMRQYAKGVYGIQQITVNAMPAWTSTYFLRRGFGYVCKQQNMHVPFVTMRALSDEENIFKKKRVPMKVMVGAGVGCFLFSTAICVAFLISYIM